MQLIRLDNIHNIKQENTERMHDLRMMFIDLDTVLQEIEDESNVNMELEATRVIELARTNLESCFMYAMKSICLIGEMRE